MEIDDQSPERREPRKIIKIILRILVQASPAVLTRAALLVLLWLAQHHFDIF